MEIDDDDVAVLFAKDWTEAAKLGDDRWRQKAKGHARVTICVIPTRKWWWVRLYARGLPRLRKPDYVLGGELYHVLSAGAHVGSFKPTGNRVIGDAGFPAETEARATAAALADWFNELLANDTPPRPSAEEFDRIMRALRLDRNHGGAAR